MMRRAIGVAGCMAVLAGCAGSGRVADLPVAPPGQAAGKLVVIRSSSFVGATNSYYVVLDGKDVFVLRSGEHTAFAVPTGEHTVGVKCFGGWSPTWKEVSASFVASPDSESYIAVGPSMSCARIRPIAAEEGRRQMAGSSFISPDQASK